MYDFFWHGGHDEKREAGGNQRGQADKPAHNAIQRVEGDVCFQEQLEEYGQSMSSRQVYPAVVAATVRAAVDSKGSQ